MNPYEALKAYHAEHIYKRGTFVGDAPCGDRRMNYFRILAPVQGQPIVVRCHRTDIVTINPEGSVITLWANGWGNSPTTRDAFYGALHCAGLVGWYLTSIKPHGVNQTAIKAGGHVHVFYDGMQFNQNGELLTSAAPVQAKRLDKEKSKALQDGVKASGFKDMFPIMFAIMFASAQVPDTTPNLPFDLPAEDIITDPDQAHLWQTLIQAYAFERRYNYTTRQQECALKVIKSGGWRNYTEREYTAKDCWNAIMRTCKRGMYKIEDMQQTSNH